MDEIVTAEIPAPVTKREPGDAEIQAAGAVVQELQREAVALGDQPAAAPVHYALGRVYGDRLGDLRSAAVCYQNAFQLNPTYRPNLEAARQLFAGAGRLDKALALHEREEALLSSPAERAESLRAQAALLAQDRRHAESARRVQKALELAPDHPALLAAAVKAAGGDKLASAKLLLRSAGSVRDDVQKAQLFRRAALLIEELQAELSQPGFPPPTPRPSAQELDTLHEEALRRLHSADARDPVGILGLLQRARASNDWEAVLRLARERAERTGGPSERVVVANIAAHRLGRVAEAVAEVKASLEDDRRDGALLALRASLAEQQGSPELADALRARAAGGVEPSERADLKIAAASLLADPLEQEQLLSEALSENPGDAAGIALHARLVALRDPAAAADRFVALGDALIEHAPEEAAGHYLEAGAWLERAGQLEEAAQMARKALSLAPRPPAGSGGGPAQGALRLLQRTLPLLGGHAELAALLEQAAADLPRGPAAEMLVRAAALLSDVPPADDSAAHPRVRALALAQRAAELARGLGSPRWLEAWTTLAVRAGDLASLSLALESRAEAALGADAADLLVEAAELSRATLDDGRAITLLHKARAADASSDAARRGLLAMPQLPTAERVDLLAEEARTADPARAAALHAERAALLEGLGRFDDAVQASAQALTLGGADLATLRRLARVQMRRADHGAALAVLTQIAQAVPEGSARAEAWARAADFAEWKVSDPRRAAELYAAAADAHPAATYALVQLGRLHAWTGRFAEAAASFEQLAQRSSLSTERTEALRWAAALQAHRNGQAGKAAELYRQLLAEAPGDLEAMAALLQLIADDHGRDARLERAELRGKLASRCQDPRCAALLRTESAQDRLAGGERDHGVAEYRRALALNPHDRIALDHVEEALRASGQTGLLAEHLAFRCAYVDGETRAALALQQAELLEQAGDLERAGAAYRQALASDPGSLLAVRGARRLAAQAGDRQEQMNLLAQEAGIAADASSAAGTLVEAALLAQDLGENARAAHHLDALIERDPRSADAAAQLRAMLGDEAPGHLAALYETSGAHHEDPAAGGAAWTQAARIELTELNDPAAAFFATSRALARDPANAEALEIRADAALATGREAEAADALAQRLALPGAPDELRFKLGRIYADKLRQPERALPLLLDRLDALDAATMERLSEVARSLPPADSARFHQRALDAAAAGETQSRATIAGWADQLARAQLALGHRAEAIESFKRAVGLDPLNRQAYRQVADLTAETAPDESIAAHRALLEHEPPEADSLHALFGLFQAQGRGDAAASAAAVLAGLGLATPEEKAVHDRAVAQPPPAELPRLAEEDLLRAPGDEGAARELLAAAAPELARALPTDLAGRGERVKGDNPVRRVCAAIARALGLAEPALYVAKEEPAVVLPTATEPPGLLVGLEVPKRHHSRQQRFLYARALAHLGRGTHPLFGMTAERLGQLVGELVRLAAPAGTDFSRLPSRDAALGEALEAAFPAEARARLSPLAARVAAEAPATWEPLALALRETAERAALAICADPAAALGIVASECPGGLDRIEIASLARFAVSEAYLSLRAR